MMESGAYKEQALPEQLGPLFELYSGESHTSFLLLPDWFGGTAFVAPSMFSLLIANDNRYPVEQIDFGDIFSF